MGFRALALVFGFACVACSIYVAYLVRKNSDTRVGIIKASQQLRRRQHVERTLARESILQELDSLSSKHHGTDMLAVAEMYHRGVYSHFAPNPKLASALYMGIVAKCDGLVAVRARGLWHECCTRSLTSGDISGSAFPLGPGRRVLARLATMVTVDTAMNTAMNTARKTVAKTAVASDPQNSHDHAVGASTKKRLEALLQEYDGPSHHAKERISDALASQHIDMSEEDKAKALAVLDTLNGDSTHSVFGVSELDALCMVFDHIDHIEDDHVKMNALETLCKQLASAYERGAVVCSTGKITRILSALDGIDTESTAKPLWVIQEELASLAAKVRADTLATLPESRQMLYERGDSPEVEEMMRKLFAEKARHVYVEGLGMDPKVLEPMLDVYLDAF